MLVNEMISEHEKELNMLSKKIQVLSNELTQIKCNVQQSIRKEDKKEPFKVLGGENHTEEQTLKVAGILTGNHCDVSTNDRRQGIVFSPSYTHGRLTGMKTVKFPSLSDMLQSIVTIAGSFHFPKPAEDETVYMTAVQLYVCKCGRYIHES